MSKPSPRSVAPATGSAARPRWIHRRTALLLAFAFSVMADPVSSVAYAIEAALRALHGDLALLLPTMALVVGVVALVVASYHQLVARFPDGGGSAAAAGSAFGEAFAFLPMGALIVDFVLTISISVSAGASAVISYAPSLAPMRLPLALILVVAVAGLMWFGHLGRAVFAALTIAFLVVAIGVLVLTAGAHPEAQPAVVAPHSPPLAVVLAFPVAMALSTGVEAPSSAIAQLAQLDADERRRFGRWALWLTLGIVGVLTLALTAAAVRLGVGIPPAESTQISEIARRSGSDGLFTAFQATTALLLLSAASSSFQAGPGLLKALARRRLADGGTVGLLPSPLGRANRHHVPIVGVGVFLVLAAAVVTAAGARDQELVLFYAVSVFVSFLVGLVAMATFARREGRRGWLVLNVAAAVVVAFTLVVNMTRPAAIGSLAATILVAGGLYIAWVRSGRPRGIAHAVAAAEAVVGEELDGEELDGEVLDGEESDGVPDEVEAADGARTDPGTSTPGR